jgi:chromosome segregation ATPase
MCAQEFDLCVPTVLIRSDSNSVVRDLIYRYTVALGSGTSTRPFELEITDPGDPLLLFDYKIAPDEFPAVREDQRLCFEYSRFPNNLTKLLNACRDHDGYRAVIDIRSVKEPYLFLQQTTKFSMLEHLTLPLVPASDDRIRQYMCSEVQRFKGSYEAALEEIARLQEELQEAISATHGRYNDLKVLVGRLREEHSQEVEGLCAKYEKELETLRQSSKEAALYQTRAYDDKEQELIRKYEGRIDALQQDIDARAEERTKLIVRAERKAEQASSLGTQLAEAKAQIEGLEADKASLLQERQDLRKENANVRTEWASVTAQWESTVAALGEKTELAESQAATIGQLKSLVASKDEDIAQLQKTIADLSEQAKDRHWIADKSKKIIAKHQEDIRKLVQHHNERKTEWEKKLEDAKAMERDHIKSLEENKALKLALETSEAKVADLAEKNESLRLEMSRLEEVKNDDRQMISYLELQLSQVEPPEAESVASGFVPPGPFGSPVRRFPPPDKGGPRSPYVPRFHYPEPGSVFDTPPFYV